MKKMLWLLIATSFLHNCVEPSNSTRNVFLGTWNNIPQDHYNHIEFYQDSAVFWDYCSYVLAEWTVQNDTLYFEQLNGTIENIGRSWYLPFRLNHNKDSLTLIMSEGNGFEMVLFKVEDEWEHFLKGRDLAIKIPLAISDMSLAQKPNHYPVLYIGLKDDKLSVNANRNKKEILTSLELMHAVYNSYYQDTKDSLFSITMVVDKSISEQTLDSIKAEVKSNFTHPIRFFRVYQPEHLETHYGHINPNCLNETYEWDWYGLWEK